MPGSDVELPPIDPPSDDDRRRVIDVLRGAGGSLGLEEAERRMDAAVRAPTKGDLALLVWDLPDAAAAAPGPTPPPRVRAWRDLPFRLHTTAYALTNAMLVGIWEITDRHDIFWPFFPIAGWGIGLTAHAVVVRGIQRRRLEREVHRLERPERQRDQEPGAIGPAPRRTRQGGAGAARPAKVVVMFTDVVGSTRLTMVIGDEDWTRVRARYREMLRGCYHAHRGMEVSSQGDGFLARFDRPADAVGCAIQVQRNLHDQRQEFGFAPAVRIGINAGEAIEEAGDVLGTTVNLAARVTTAADPHQILVTETVADSLDDRFHVKDEGLRDMKGLERRVHVLSVIWQ